MIGIISAMDIEMKTLVHLLKDKKKKVHAGLDYYTGKLDGVDVVICRCGVGKVNAAMHTQILIDKYKPKALIQNGIAGSLVPEVGKLDLVVGSELVYHDMQEFVIKNFDPLEPVYYSDEKLLAKAKEVAGDEGGVHIGRIATGDTFVSSTKEKNAIYKKTKALCVEMEGCAVAHTAYLNKVPFVVLRCISDSADDDATESFDELMPVAADCLVDMITHLIKII